VHDRINDVKTRMELLKRDHLPARESDFINKEEQDSHAAEEIKALNDDYLFLQEVNTGREFLNDDMIIRIKEIAQRKLSIDGRSSSLLSDEEVYNLCIRNGTLNDQERNIINNHALITHKMLAQLPFPKRMRNVAAYAAAHHEKIDGTGYPLGLKGDQIPLQSRIIAIADIFEALTAKDRPYKNGKSLSEALKIMEEMVVKKDIDPDLFELLTKENVYADYAVRELSAQQIDI
jgi:hypothetical protein